MISNSSVSILPFDYLFRNENFERMPELSSEYEYIYTPIFKRKDLRIVFRLFEIFQNYHGSNPYLRRYRSITPFEKDYNLYLIISRRNLIYWANVEGLYNKKERVKLNLAFLFKRLGKEIAEREGIDFSWNERNENVLRKISFDDLDVKVSDLFRIFKILSGKNLNRL